MILIALGSNLSSAAGTPAETVAAALAALRANEIEPVKVSRFYRSEAWPDRSDPPFVNAVAQLDTVLPPSTLLESLHAIERLFGRTRDRRNAPRTLDLDILDYEGRVEAGPPVLPHPRMAARAFVLLPLAEIAPDWRHPVSGGRITELIAQLPAEMKRPQPLPIQSPSR
ncbi:MAG TPA: 2-amino-4-hydroxy-6-hydroxymethyldihydropteridine diphosphokinase [Rhizomicrobium sp.]|jgi:2-amino-4-hydroxy-6-hydroxymethyldihydropteridine diphosphokinase|nr:2-amino-4-hydroxy-6-hydroxymethyldihydropteridine diphosphokinase [Rhizomicrobium sp.]